jgi:hypothetical protein
MAATSQLRLKRLGSAYSVCRLPADSDIPHWAKGEICSITRTRDELSVVCPTANVVDTGIARSDGWTCLKLQGPFDLNETGILASVVLPLAEDKISVFTVSTFDSDYLLIPQAQLFRAVQCLTDAGHTIEDS